MNKLALATVSLLATSMLTDAALAAGDTTKATDATQGATAVDQRYGSVRNNATFEGSVTGDHSVEELMEREVTDASGNDIGEIEDLLVNSDNTVTKVLVDVGGFLGIGEKRVAVDIDQLTFGVGDGEVIINMTEEQLEALPAFEYRDDSWMPFAG